MAAATKVLNQTQHSPISTSSSSPQSRPSSPFNFPLNHAPNPRVCSSSIGLVFFMVNYPDLCLLYKGSEPNPRGFLVQDLMASFCRVPVQLQIRCR
ncbi:hypothetical protein AKJ16_DCAP18467 [Drosera capensis]